LTPNPIDVVLLVDRSGSMGDAMGDGNTEMKDAQTGAKTFVTMMNSSNDRIAVVSFSGDSNNKYNVDTTINSPLTTNAAAINAAITSLSPTSATGTRDGLYQSIALLNNNPNSNPKAVRAVILLTDGDYNWLGDPLGRGTGYYPAPPSTGYTGYSTGNLEPNRYLFYNGLGGALNAPLNANFIANATNGTAVQFTDTSTGTPTGWSWNFGDNPTSTSQNPTHTFSGKGTYTIKETVTNGYGNDVSD